MNSTSLLRRSSPATTTLRAFATLRPSFLLFPTVKRRFSSSACSSSPSSSSSPFFRYHGTNTIPPATYYSYSTTSTQQQQPSAEGEAATSKKEAEAEDDESGEGETKPNQEEGAIAGGKKRTFTEAERLLQSRRDLFVASPAPQPAGGASSVVGFEFDKPKYAHLQKWKPQVVDVETVSQQIKFPEPDVYIFDVRPEVTTKRILTAIEMTVFDVYTNLKLTHQQWQAKFLRAKPDEDDDIVVVSWNGEDSEIAAVLLKMAGYKRVYNCRDGLAAIFHDDHHVDNPTHDDAVAREIAKQMQSRPLSHEDKVAQLRKQTFGDLHPTAVDEVWPADLTPDQISSLNVEK